MARKRERSRDEIEEGERCKLNEEEKKTQREATAEKMARHFTVSEEHVWAQLLWTALANREI